MTLIEYSPQYDPLRFIDVPTPNPDEWPYSVPVPDSKWGINNSNFDHYANRFGYDSWAIRDLLERQIGRDPNNVGIDIAGGESGQALQQLMAEGFLGKAVVTNYQDNRDASTKAIDNLDHIRGDIMERRTWERMMTWQSKNAPDGFALVLHRPYGALQDLRPGFYRGAVHLLMDMTKPNGLLLLQIPMKVGGLNRAATLAALRRSAVSRDDVAEIHVAPDSEANPLYQHYPSLVTIVKTAESPY